MTCAVAVRGRGENVARAGGLATAPPSRPSSACPLAVTSSEVRAVAIPRRTHRAALLGISLAIRHGRTGALFAAHFAAHAQTTRGSVTAGSVAAHSLGTVSAQALSTGSALATVRLLATRIVHARVGGDAIAVGRAGGQAGAVATEKGRTGLVRWGDAIAVTIAVRRRGCRSRVHTDTLLARLRGAGVGAGSASALASVATRVADAVLASPLRIGRAIGNRGAETGGAGEAAGFA